MSAGQPRWRIVFMGTPTFAVPILEGLLRGDDPVVGVFTQPDKAVGRGLQTVFSPVKQLALQHGIPLFQPHRLRAAEAVESLRALQADLLVVVAYGQILSADVLALPRWGCLNIHASLLPRWRGAAPIHRALLAGDAQTGITLMRMDEGLDTGPMLCWRSLPISGQHTVGLLHDQLAQMGADLLRESLPLLKAGQLPLLPQAQEGVTYAAKLTADDERITWSRTAVEIERQIRALNPWPVAHTLWEGKPLKIFASRLLPEQGEPGQIVARHSDGLQVACAEQSLLLTEVQPAGKKRMAAADWLRGLSRLPERLPVAG
ncbi:MAG: methionyl-tRNA formyltransferase [Magnetococcales bacterium]|nr:methionyl-tRNA formyltransferase [Magnetococcales bacterium]